MLIEIRWDNDEYDEYDKLRYKGVVVKWFDNNDVVFKTVSPHVDFFAAVTHVKLQNMGVAYGPSCAKFVDLANQGFFW